MDLQNGHTVNGLRRTPPKENCLDLVSHKKDAVSPHSGTSSTSSTPAPKKSQEEPSKPSTPKSGRSTPPGAGASGLPGPPGPPYGVGYPPSSLSKKFWDEMQPALMCCGAEGWKDWENAGHLKAGHKVPASCCNTQSGRVIDHR